MGVGHWGRIFSFLGASLMTQMVMNPPASAVETGSIPGLGRSPGEENGNLL